MTKAHGISPRALRIVATHSAIAGLCPLIPVPYVDDLLIRRVTRRMFTALFEAHDLQLAPAGAKALTATPSAWLRGAATSVAMFPLRRVLRKVVYLLAIKDCADVASLVFHDGWLLAHMLERPSNRGSSVADPKYLQRVRKAMLSTYKDIDPAPLRRALVGAFLGAKVGAEHAAQAAARVRSGEPVKTDGVDKLSKRMLAAARVQWKYLDALHQRFEHHLGHPAAEVGESPTAAAS